MNTLFTGREKELRLLRELRLQEQATIGVVYGRRRIGKSELITHAFSGERLLIFEGLENQNSEIQITTFLKQLESYFPEKQVAQDKISGWYDALILLAKLTANQSFVILFDEFQWLANYRTQLVSVLKLVWDQHLSKNRGLTLILCGSVASFMVHKVVKSKAIYGRISQAIHLKQFKLKDTYNLLSRGPEEAILAQLLVGGVPGYLKLLSTKGSVYLGVQELAFEQNGYFTSEFERIFISQFGRSHVYEQVIRTLGRHPQGLTRAELSREKELSNGGSLSNYLFDLETAGLITSFSPYTKSDRETSKIYLVTDPYIRLYLNFLEPHLTQIRSGKPNLFINLTGTPQFNSWLGLACEILCLEHSYELATLMGFSNVRYNSGPFFLTGQRNLKRGVQVDLVYKRMDRVLTVCEIKYRSSALSASVIEEVDRKVELLPKKGNLTIQKALITKEKVSSEILKRGYFSHIVTLDQLISV